VKYQLEIQSQKVPFQNQTSYCCEALGARRPIKFSQGTKNIKFYLSASCGALSLQQKTLYYRGDSDEIAPTPNAKFLDPVVATDWRWRDPRFMEQPEQRNLKPTRSRPLRILNLHQKNLLAGD
jgi:hypothetical protein